MLTSCSLCKDIHVETFFPPTFTNRAERSVHLLSGQEACICESMGCKHDDILLGSAVTLDG